MQSRTNRWVLLALVLAVATGWASAEVVTLPTPEAPEPEPGPVKASDVAEDGTPYPIDALAVRTRWTLGKIEPALEQESLGLTELDVIIYLKSSARGRSPSEVKALHLAGIKPFSDEVRAIERKYRPEWSLDEEDEKTVMEIQESFVSAEDKARRLELNLEIDRRLDALRTEVRQSILYRTEPEQDEVAKFIQELGGEVRVRILSVNALGAKIPSQALLQLAEHPLVTTIVDDPPVDYELDVSVPSAGYTTWHGAALDGGAFDSGLVDSGVQTNNPTFAGQLFYTDSATSNDLRGHGTHVTGIMLSSDATNRGTAWGLDAHIWGQSGSQATTMSRMDILTTTLVQSPEVINHSLGYFIADGTDYSANDSFYDAFVQNFNVQVTKSSGNEGWSAVVPRITHPGPAYNIIVVANMADQNSATRTDDVRRTSSSTGPTLNGRRKPDITAPGTDIMSTNAHWAATQDSGTCTDTGAVCHSNADCSPAPEYCSFSCGGRFPGDDFANCTGTSMAAPHVAGAIILMEDGGNNNPEAQKAVLINTADWWDSAGTSGTGDDGQVTVASTTPGDVEWDMSYGWGYIDMTEAHFNRTDYFTPTLVPRNDNATEDDYKLYMGYMVANEKATMTWIKRSAYLAGVAPTTTYSLSDLNLRLYSESDGTSEDHDLDGDDNVHQVEAHSAGFYVVKPYAWSTSFSGASSEAIALAVEENFVEVPFPDNFGAAINRPNPVQPNEIFDISFWVTNNGEVTSHQNAFTLTVPPGWVLVSGSLAQSVGSIGAGTSSPLATWRLQAQGTSQNGVVVQIVHAHSSYGESFSVTHQPTIDVVQDLDPPSPNPMYFNNLPFELNTSQIQMVATTATDPHGPVEYYHQYDGSPTGGTGASNSGWTTAKTFTDSGLQTNHNYCYRVWARDNPTTSANPTVPSSQSCDYTDIETPSGITYGTIGTSSIQARSTNALSNLAFGSSGLQVQNVTTGDNSGWKKNNDYWTSPGLTPNSPYSFRAYARNGDAGTTPLSPTSVKYTWARTPTVGWVVPVLNDTTLRATWGANGNPSGTEYFAENITNGTNSGWTTATLWDSTGLGCGGSYTLRVRARNGDLVQTSLVVLGTGTAGFDWEGDGLPDCVDPDDDNDGALDPNDCAQRDAAVWWPPSEAYGLELSHAGGVTDLSWQAPVAPGTTATVFYDTIVSKFGDLWGASDEYCMEPDDGDLTAVHGDMPMPGNAFFFITRPENRCGNGPEGTGEDVPSGTPIPRNARDCGCAHARCDEGGPLEAACDPCVAAICTVDAFCCDTAWDSYCVEEVASVCGETCP